MPSRADDDLTLGTTTAAVGPRTPASGPAPSGAFAPGAVIGGRYRLVALLGRGGMGEVYRADDLLLDHPVALKFLPEGAAATPERLAQFHNELRIARQVSHKNICRLYDLGDADGRRFLTMEYVDGEDLASLLRRIGRLPPDKAVEIARQLCAGLAAAHERGVLHRDLKPANVMIDGEGNVRITDFGLAVATRDIDAAHAGTPQYMAPEQLRGERASIRSDIYALGLVLFEMFTGRRPYEAKTLQELVALHDSRSAISTPTAIVRDLDPAIERAILRCLERDPDRRPPSALTVAASLPGADPLAAALAAGETPSPDLLVAAGETEATAVGPAAAAVVIFLLVLGAFAALSTHASLAGIVPLQKPPAVLLDRIAMTMASLGYTDPSTDRAFGFTVRQDALAWAQKTSTAPNWWPDMASGTPPALVFWFRSSPQNLVPRRANAGVTPTDPPADLSGMRSAVVDTQGRLLEFHAVPPQVDPPATGAAPVPDWKPLFDAAGQDMTRFTPVAPQWTPPDFADMRAAWEGPLAARPEIRVRVETAAYRGRPTSFAIVGPWSRPVRMQPRQRTTLQVVGGVAAFLVWNLSLLVAALLARHNLRTNRADRRGAARLAVTLLLAGAVASMIASHHVSAPDVELYMLLSSMATVTFEAGAVWVLYLALEPYARRFWPDGLLGWSRLLAARLRDPRVGREILIGIAFGAALLVVEAARAFLPPLVGRPEPPPPFGDAVSMLTGPSMLLVRWEGWIYSALESALLIAFLFVVLRLLLRRQWLALTVGIAVVTLVSDNAAALTGGPITLVYSLAIVTLAAVAVVRYGLLALAVALVIDNSATSTPLSLNVSAWWAGGSNLTLAALVALACFGFYAARAGQPLFGRLEV